MNEESSLAVSPIALLFVIAMGVLSWKSPRPRAVWPLLMTAAFIPLGQGIVVAGLHFYFFRLLLMLGLARVIIKGELRDVRWTPMDKGFLWWSAVALICGVLVKPSMPQFINFAGFVFNALGCYFYVRCLVRKPEEVIGMLRCLAVVAIVLGGSMLVEKLTARNVFAVLGGVPPETITRDGKLRCQGTFLHPIVAGTFGATLFPLMVGLWFQDKSKRRLASFAIVGCVLMVGTASSSGAILGLAAACIGLVMWKMKTRMQVFRRTVVVVLIALSLIMKAPVYYLFARVSDIMGGTGWHRSFIIDAALEHIGEWWLVGTYRTVHWGGYPPPPADPENIDITNQYIVEGVKGGLLRLGLFILIISRGFKAIGRWTSLRRPPSRSVQWLYWSIGVCLATHCVSYMSVSYFDQMVVFWYWLLAVIAALSLVPVGESAGLGGSPKPV
jgi:hypothetical protein